MSEKWISLVSNPTQDPSVQEAVPAVVTPELEDITNFSRTQVETLLTSKLSDYEFGRILFEELTGTRDGETFGAQFGDLGMDDEGIRFIHILRQSLASKAERLVRLGPLKTKNSKRRVPLHPLLATWLDWWRAEGWEARVGRKPKAGDFLFPSATGELQRPPRAAQGLRELLDKAGLPTAFVTSDGVSKPFGAHSHRHTFASRLGENEIMGEFIDRLLGHAPQSVRGRHYQAVKLGPLARAVGTLDLTLPERPGVDPQAGNRPAIAPGNGKPNDSEANQESFWSLTRAALPDRSRR